jgi:hypothetical protein
MLILAVILSAAGVVAAQGPSAPGSVAGCISDSMRHERLPGATVVAKGGGVQRSAEADSSGCYELRDLPPATYRVTARLAGFDNVTRDGLVVSPSTATRFDITTRLSAICECVRVTGTLAEHWDHANAVLHMRLSDSEPAPSTPRGYYRHAATVLSALKEPEGPRPGAIFILQNQRSGVPGPYEVGQELVAFLESSGSETLSITNDEPGLAISTGADVPSMVFLVHDGHVQSSPPEFSRYVGMPIDRFLGELRKLSHHK